MKDMGLTAIILRIRVKQESDGLYSLTQSLYGKKKQWQVKTYRRRHAWHMLSNGVIALDYIGLHDNLLFSHKPDKLLLGKVQVQKIPFPMHIDSTFSKIF